MTTAVWRVSVEPAASNGTDGDRNVVISGIPGSFGFWSYLLAKPRTAHESCPRDRWFSTYWLIPSGRRRRSRSCPYLARSASGLNFRSARSSTMVISRWCAQAVAYQAQVRLTAYFSPIGSTTNRRAPTQKVCLRGDFGGIRGMHGAIRCTVRAAAQRRTSQINGLVSDEPSHTHRTVASRPFRSYTLYAMAEYGTNFHTQATVAQLPRGSNSFVRCNIVICRARTRHSADAN
jgi:hypothetical protein